MDLKGEIVRRVEAFSLKQQYQVLAYCNTIEDSQFTGEGTAALLSFFGTLDDTSAKEMLEAINETCETVDPREW